MRKFLFSAVKGVQAMRKFLFPVVIGIVVLAFTDWYFITAANYAYEEKIKILSVMIEGQEKGADSFMAAAELLKGAVGSSGEAGKEKLESYGYLEGRQNWFGLERKISIRNVVLLSAAVFLLYLLALGYLHWQCRNQWQRELKALSGTLDKFSKHIYELNIPEQLSGGQGEMDRIAGQLSALSEQLRYNEERLNAEREETRSLVTDISHQLKTPVAGLKTCFEILSQGNLSPEKEQEFIAQCMRQLAGLEALVGALVNISRMETGMIEIHQKPADILETLVAAVNRVYLKAEEKKIAIEFEETEDLKPTIIPHDVKWLCEAFINILENAVKYSPGDTEICVRMIRMATFLRIEIEDQGIGIPREDYHKIFKRFYRGEAEEVRKAEGSGVGLYLTREILEHHRGSVTVSSRHGMKRQGSTFVVQIPYH